MKNQAQIRHNPINNRSVIFAPKRTKRPSDIKNKKNNFVCPFCPENIKKQELLQCLPEKEEWLAAVKKNLFPALSAKNKKAYGCQEIIIDTNQHCENFADLSLNQITLLLTLFQLRSNNIIKDQKIKYILCFKNQGKSAGASLRHIHSQIFASSILPPDIIEERNRIAEYYEKHQLCPYCQEVKQEIIGPRLIWQDQNMISFCPPVSEYPYEAWIISKRHVDNIGLLSKKEIFSLAKALKLIAKKLEGLEYDFNFFTHNDIPNKHQHFYLKIQPRPGIWAGVELGSGLIINSVFPEDAAKYYKK